MYFRKFMPRICQKMWNTIAANFRRRIQCILFLISTALSGSSPGNREPYDIYYEENHNRIGCSAYFTTNPPSDVTIIPNRCDLDVKFSSVERLMEFWACLNLRGCSSRTVVLASLNLSNAEHFKRNGHLLNDTFAGLCELKGISLSKQNIKIIEPQAFRCLHQIEDLYLRENEIEFLPDDVFKNMWHLIYLDISVNNINALTLGIFDDLVSLKYLLLESNSIDHLPDDIFRHLSELGRLHLSQNRLKQLNGSGISYLAKLYALFLSGNSLEILTDRDSLSGNQKLQNISDLEGRVYLNDETLEGLFDLNILEMAKCNLTSLPTGFFSPTHKITSLILKHNHIAEITQHFGTLRNLKKLDLSFNEISALRNQPFKYNSKLVYLLLRGNKLSIIDGSYFKNLMSLNYLDMSCNNILSLAYGSFDSLHELDSLNVSRNSIFHWPGSQLLRNNTKLRTLDLSYNRLTDISAEDWQNRHGLVWFGATNNLITELDISRMPQSSEVHLERNRVRRIYSNDNVSQFSNKKISVYLLGNPLECDCEAYRLHRRLQERSWPNVLFVDDLICQAPQRLKGKKINVLKPAEFICRVVEDCPRECVCTLQGHDDVRVVNCSNRGYAELPQEAPFNTSVLDIRQNNLTTLERLSEPPWENLTVLRAEGNGITSEEFHVPRNLKFLGLGDNKLKALPAAVQRHAEGAKDFKMLLARNLWPCDCSSLSFRKFVSKHTTQIVDAAEIRCLFANGTRTATALTTMDDFELCPSFLVTAAVYSASAWIVLMVASFVVFYYRHKSHILCYLYTHCSRFCLLLCCHKLDNEEKQFDCFISYSSADADVAYAILGELECKPPHFKFCIHERNWMPGQFITRNILQSVQNSRKTLIVLSQNFTKSEWFRMEFQAAHRQMLRDRRDRLIFVLKGELPGKDELDRDVRQAVAWKTYLRWGEGWFWEKLRQAVWEQPALIQERSRNVATV